MIQWENEPLKGHTTFRIGGPARYYLVPESEEEIYQALDFAKEKGLPYYVVGKGSNMLFSDNGYEGVIIEIGKGLEQVEIREDGSARAQAGIALGGFASKLSIEGLTGFEFAAGIPGTLGGGIAMNAGAYGGEIKDCLIRAKILTPEGDILWLDNEQLELGYRSSIIQKESYLVLEGEFAFERGDVIKIQEKMRDLSRQRREKQPLEYPSAGSTFKRPAGNFAGRLIDEAGMRGYRIGDAQVSEKHCGFVVNRGQATAADVIQVIQDVQDKVYSESGIMLEPEVRLIGF